MQPEIIGELKGIRYEIDCIDNSLLFRLGAMAVLPRHPVHLWSDVEYSPEDHKTSTELSYLLDRRLRLTDRVATTKYEDGVEQLLKTVPKDLDHSNNGSLKPHIIQIHHPDREEAILQRLERTIKSGDQYVEFNEDLTSGYLKNFWEEIFNLSCLRQGVKINSIKKADRLLADRGKIVDYLQVYIGETLFSSSRGIIVRG